MENIRKYLRGVVLCAVILAGCGMGMLMSGCATPGDLPEYEQRSPESARTSSARRVSMDRPQLVGKVSLVNTGDKFVLIELQTARIPEPGRMLHVYDGQMKSAELKVSKEQRRPFVIADITNGSPQQEDMVYLQPSRPASTTGSGSSRGSQSSSGGAGPYAADPGLPADDGAPVPTLDLLGADEEPDYSDEEGILPDDLGFDVDPDAQAPLLDAAPDAE